MQSADQQTLVILDVDSTLVYTHQRNQAIIQDFWEDRAELYPQDIAKIRQMACQPNDYGYYSALKRLDVSFTHSALADDLHRYWHRRFFSSDYLHHDRPYPGAVEFVRTLQQKSIAFCYLTGRHRHPMLAGTKKSFTTLGFPFVPEQLILKEDPQEKDENYKSREIKKLTGRFARLVIIDNEPVILNRIASDFPHIQLVWFKSTHSGLQEPPAQALTISDFL